MPPHSPTPLTTPLLPSHTPPPSSGQATPSLFGRPASRPAPPTHTGLLCDLLWSDPDPDITGWAENDRGVSYTFGADMVTRFLEKHDFDLVVRAHQVVEDGYEFFADRQLVTIFSAPNYCGEFDNAGAVRGPAAESVRLPARSPQPPRTVARRSWRSTRA